MERNFPSKKKYRRTKVIIVYLAIVSALLLSSVWNLDRDIQDGCKFHFSFIPTSISVLSLFFFIFTILVWVTIYFSTLPTEK